MEEYQGLRAQGSGLRAQGSGLGETMKFAFQKLDVWQLAVEFADAVISATENLQTPRQHYRLIEKLEAAST